MKTTKATRSDSRESAAQRVRPFTLVEMMVVIVIIAIVMGIAIPAFQKMGSGSAVRAATRIVSGQIRLTRQYAISQRKKIALIMPADGVGSATLTDENAYMAMKPAIVSQSGTTFTFVEWVENTKWTRIPRGAVIAEMDDDPGIYSSGWTDTPKDDSFAKVNISPSEMDDLQEGLSGSAADVRAIVFSPTGRVIGPTTANATIAQLTRNSGVWISKNRGTSGNPDWATPNQFNINVNVYTGRIKITTPNEY